MYTMRFSNEIDSLPDIASFVRKTSRHFGIDDSTMRGLELATDEAVTNVIRHSKMPKNIAIEIKFSVNGNEARIELFDSGIEFNPCMAPLPDLNLVPLERDVSGLGIHLMKHSTDSMRYKRTTAGQNHLVLVRKIHSV